ncbi:hypothetical protein DFP72DRAFT_843441 [Ephemerocybe angulata]|uniref:Uncharacterized protein n=1 Tax=Ephemerocybe angulata TaxID=980116 RepID=A0A8H6IA24_9AGAR|nr:hypothetical protein DFP72DRAFT_843441 [Tulosesus angulatus]
MDVMNTRNDMRRLEATDKRNRERERGGEEEGEYDEDRNSMRGPSSEGGGEVRGCVREAKKSWIRESSENEIGRARTETRDESSAWSTRAWDLSASGCRLKPAPPRGEGGSPDTPVRQRLTGFHPVPVFSAARCGAWDASLAVCYLPPGPRESSQSEVCSEYRPSYNFDGPLDASEPYTEAEELAGGRRTLSGTYYAMAVLARRVKRGPSGCCGTSTQAPDLPSVIEDVRRAAAWLSPGFQIRGLADRSDVLQTRPTKTRHRETASYLYGDLGAERTEFYSPVGTVVGSGGWIVVIATPPAKMEVEVVENKPRGASGSASPNERAGPGTGDQMKP